MRKEDKVVFKRVAIRATALAICGGLAGLGLWYIGHGSAYGAMSTVLPLAFFGALAGFAASTVAEATNYYYDD